jgi:hypothetical protein
MIRSPRLALPALALAAVVLAGCAPSAPSASTPTPSTPVVETTPPEPTPTPTETTEPAPVEATCENTATPEALALFAEYNWTAGKVEDPWIIVEDLSAGVACTWGDFTTQTDNVSWLAWAPLPDAQAESVITALMNQGGWLREDAAEGVYITAADASQGLHVDDQGYGMTYRFGDGQVAAATTKAELVSITAPPGFTP